MTATDQPDMIRAKLNLETSKIAWKDLQRFFAAGMALAVAEDLDLVEVAFQVSKDNATQIREWMSAGKFGKVSDEQSGAWFERDELLWAVVISPWVLVQPVRK
jgi:hypothetical protein